MGKYLHLFGNVTEFDNYLNSNYEEPFVSATNVGGTETPSYRVDYNLSEEEKRLGTPLTFEIISGGTIGWLGWGDTQNGNNTIEYKKNNENWVSISSTIYNMIHVQAGDKLQFRNDADGPYTDYDNYGYTFFDYGDGEEYPDGVRYNLKGNIMSLINSTNFSSLITLTSSNMFANLFQGCTGLTDASNLVLPATTLTNNCYNGMFSYCSNLTTSPVLPAIILVEGCYSTMFVLCEKLNYIKCLATDISATNCTNDWTYGVASSGTFVKAAGMNDWPTGANGIPENWTVQDAS